MSIPYIASRNLDEVDHRLRISDAVNALIDGKLNVTGTLTLAANVATTVVSDNKFESQMTPLLIPTTANAAAEIGAGTLYVSARTRGSFTLTHANNAQTDRTFLYARLG